MNISLFFPRNPDIEMDMFQPCRPHFNLRSLDVSPTWSMILPSAGTTGVSLVLCRTNKNGCCPLLKGATKPNLLLQSISSSGIYMGVSKNRDTPKSSILIGFSIINHPFWGTSIFGNTHGPYLYTQNRKIWVCFTYNSHSTNSSLSSLSTLSQVPVQWWYPPPSPNPPTTVKHHRHPIKGADHCLRNCVAPQEFLFSQLWIQNQNCMQHNF